MFRRVVAYGKVRNHGGGSAAHAPSLGHIRGVDAAITPGLAGATAAQQSLLIPPSLTGNSLLYPYTTNLFSSQLLLDFAHFPAFHARPPSM